MRDNTSVPKWLIASVGGLLTILLGGALAWMTSIESRVAAQVVSLVELRTKQESLFDSISEIKSQCGSLIDKMDVTNRVVTEIKKDVEYLVEKRPSVAVDFIGPTVAADNSE